jgi:hypothetical protein
MSSAILDGMVHDVVVRNKSVRRLGNLCSVQKTKRDQRNVVDFVAVQSL